MKWPWNREKKSFCPICGDPRESGYQTCGKQSCKGKIARLNYPVWKKTER